MYIVQNYIVNFGRSPFAPAYFDSNGNLIHFDPTTKYEEISLDHLRRIRATAAKGSR